MLEAASVAGVEFSAAAVAAGVNRRRSTSRNDVPHWPAGSSFCRRGGTAEWPDGTAARYGFIHAVYQEGVYERVPAGRVWLHQRIGARQEAGYGAGAGDSRCTGGPFRARATSVGPCSICGRPGEMPAAQCPSGGDRHLTRGLALPQTLPDTPERLLQELALQASLGTPLIATKGWAAPEVATAYRRAQALWEQAGETPQHCWVLYGLCAWHAMRAEGRPRGR